MKKVVQKLIESLEVTFEKAPWFGDSVLEKITTIDYKIVNEKINGSNTIALLLKHMVQWRLFAIEKLQANKDFDIELNSSKDWPLVTINNEKQWLDLIDELKATQAKLIALISEKEDHYFKEITLGKNYTNYFLIEGVVQHDIYHLGQIGMLNSMLQNK